MNRVKAHVKFDLQQVEFIVKCLIEVDEDTGITTYDSISGRASFFHDALPHILILLYYFAYYI